MPRTVADSVFNGTWLVPPLRRGYKSKPHLYVSGTPRAVCGRGRKPDRALEFNWETGMTSVDPRLGSPQFRRPCAMCEAIYMQVMMQYGSEPENTKHTDLEGEVGSVFDRLDDVKVAGFVVTRSIGTSASGVARFEVDTSMSTDAKSLTRLLFMFTRTCTSVAFLDRATTPQEEDDRPEHRSTL